MEQMPAASNALLLFLLLLTCATPGKHHLLRVVALLTGDTTELCHCRAVTIEVWERRDSQSNSLRG